MPFMTKRPSAMFSLFKVSIASLMCHALGTKKDLGNIYQNHHPTHPPTHPHPAKKAILWSCEKIQWGPRTFLLRMMVLPRSLSLPAHYLWTSHTPRARLAHVCFPTGPSDRHFGPSWTPFRSNLLEGTPWADPTAKANRTAQDHLPLQGFSFLNKTNPTRFLFYNFTSELTTRGWLFNFPGKEIIRLHVGQCC
jgi:hypothetical protein